MISVSSMKPSASCAKVCALIAAASSAATITVTRIRAMTPRLRKSGSASGISLGLGVPFIAGGVYGRAGAGTTRRVAASADIA